MQSGRNNELATRCRGTACSRQLQNAAYCVRISPTGYNPVYPTIFKIMPEQPELHVGQCLKITGDYVGGPVTRPGDIVRITGFRTEYSDSLILTTGPVGGSNETTQNYWAFYSFRVTRGQLVIVPDGTHPQPRVLGRRNVTPLPLP